MKEHMLIVWYAMCAKKKKSVLVLWEVSLILIFKEFHSGYQLHTSCLAIAE